MDVRLKRIYDPVAASDGDRILIDRLWPPGFSREDAHIDEWARDLGPSTELRRWFGQQPACWEEFRRRYAAELVGKETLLAELRRRGRRRSLTLVYSARDTEHNDAVVLAEVLLRRQPLREGSEEATGAGFGQRLAGTVPGHAAAGMKRAFKVTR
jgi:uncharacterized protein YeaO (DUF488 family)